MVWTRNGEVGIRVSGRLSLQSFFPSFPKKKKNNSYVIFLEKYTSSLVFLDCRGSIRGIEYRLEQLHEGKRYVEKRFR